jgi:Polyketide cyclase / dehydrase and lipid transport
MSSRGWALAAGAVVAAGGVAAAGALGYFGLITGRLHLDLGVGRQVRPLGSQTVDIAAPREAVFDVVAQPYLGRATRAQQEKIRVLERGDDLVLAAHFTPIGGGLVAQTVETVRFTRPDHIDFQLVRGPVPHVRERFALTDHDGGTRLEYTGELGADGWGVGAWWAELVAGRWEATVAASLDSVKAEAERRHGGHKRAN